MVELSVVELSVVELSVVELSVVELLPERIVKRTAIQVKRARWGNNKVG